MNIAKQMLEITDWTLMLLTADKFHVTAEQDYEKETTVFNFEDGSKLKMNGKSRTAKEV